jgi:hypothetical protein
MPFLLGSPHQSMTVVDKCQATPEWIEQTNGKFNMRISQGV